MAIVGNKLYRKEQTKQDEIANIDQQIGRVEEDVRKLKIDFDIYFNGGAKRPHSKRGRDLKPTSNGL